MAVALSLASAQTSIPVKIVRTVQQGKNGHLLFSDVAANVIYKWTTDAPLSVFLENSGYNGKDVLNPVSINTSVC